MYPLIPISVIHGSLISGVNCICIVMSKRQHGIFTWAVVAGSKMKKGKFGEKDMKK